MRLLHATDIHIDAVRHGWRNPATGRNTASESLYSCFQHLCTEAVRLNVDAMLLTGDIFDTGRPTAESIRQITEPLRPVIAAGIPVIAEDGNHGRHGVPAGHRGPADLLRDIGVTVYDDIGVVRVDTHNGPLQVLTVPWPERAVILQALGIDPANLTDPKQADNMATLWLNDAVEEVASRIDPSLPAVLASHVTVTDAKISRGSETVVNTRGIFNEVTLPSATLNQLPIAYAGLGHIHVQQHVGKGSYAGSIDRLTFGEADDPKGGLLVEMNGADLTRTLVETPARRMANINLGVGEPDLSTLTEGTLVKIALAPGERTVPDTIRKQIKDAGAVLVRTKYVPAPRKARTETVVAEGTTAHDATAAWLADTVKDPAARERLLAKAATLIDPHSIAAHSAPVPQAVA